MAEYIERERLLYKFREIMSDVEENELADTLYDIAANLSAADVDPVKHGRWIEDGIDCVCSFCKCREGASNTRYCPECGARMYGSSLDLPNLNWE